MAWGQLDLCCLGWNAWRGTCGGKNVEGKGTGLAGHPCPSALDLACRRLSFRLSDLDLFQGSDIFFRGDDAGGIRVFHWEHVYSIAALFLAMCVVPMLLVDLELERANAEYLFEHHSYPLKIGIGLVFIVLITLFAANSQSAFIYFQF